MKADALTAGGRLLTIMPELSTNDCIEWKEIGVGVNFRSLCVLLQGNAIPTKSLNFWCKMKNDNTH